MMDTAYYGSFAVNSNFPQAGNHLNANTGNSAGENVSFLDGHVEWHNLSPGESWRIYGSSFYWTPRFDAPPGAVYLAP